MGQKVSALVKGQKNAGVNQVHWDGTNDQGEQVPSGLYVYQMIAADFKQTNKMLFLK